jgi:hypothetical protein
MQLQLLSRPHLLSRILSVVLLAGLFTALFVTAEGVLPLRQRHRPKALIAGRQHFRRQLKNDTTTDTTGTSSSTSSSTSPTSGSLLNTLNETTNAVGNGIAGLPVFVDPSTLTSGIISLGCC